MRLSCPECLTEYEVADAALANRTRTLRCAHCGYQWVHAAPAFESPAFGAASEVPLDGVETGVWPAAEEVVESESSAVEVGAAETPLVPDEVLAPVTPRVPTARPVQPAPVRRGRLVFVLLVLVVIAAVFAAHEPLMKAYPASARFFAAFGLH